MYCMPKPSVLFGFSVLMAIKPHGLFNAKAVPLEEQYLVKFPCFNGISIVLCYLMPNLSTVEEQFCYN